MRQRCPTSHILSCHAAERSLRSAVNLSFLFRKRLVYFTWSVSSKKKMLCSKFIAALTFTIDVLMRRLTLFCFGAKNVQVKIYRLSGFLAFGRFFCSFSFLSSLICKMYSNTHRHNQSSIPNTHTSLSLPTSSPIFPLCPLLPSSSSFTLHYRTAFI